MERTFVAVPSNIKIINGVFVLVAAGMELIVFLIAGIVLFGFSMKIMLLTL